MTRIGRRFVPQSTIERRVQACDDRHAAALRLTHPPVVIDVALVPDPEARGPVIEPALVPVPAANVSIWELVPFSVSEMVFGRTPEASAKSCWFQPWSAISRRIAGIHGRSISLSRSLLLHDLTLISE